MIKTIMNDGPQFTLHRVLRHM